MMTITRYTAADAAEWDAFVRTSVNATFLFLRGYMDYHADRFADHSLMFRSTDGAVRALLPANEQGGELWSHQGLTYGGLLRDRHTRDIDVAEAFQLLTAYMRAHALTALHYKAVPAVYHTLPSDDDIYWLWRHGATMEVCNLAMAVDLSGTREGGNPETPPRSCGTPPRQAKPAATLCRGRQSQPPRSAVEHFLIGRQSQPPRSAAPVSPSRRTNRNKLLRQGYTIASDAPLAEFWPVLEDNLRTAHNATPVHTLQEMSLLQSRFPDAIRCFTVSAPDGTVLGGTVLYLTPDVVHTQYISATPAGKRCRALDLLLLTLVEQARDAGYRWFDFGTCNEQQGRLLNASLVEQKEGFGARGVACMQLVVRSEE